MSDEFVLVQSSVLPMGIVKVLEAKKLLANGTAKNVSAAINLVGISRSAFYKYKDCVFTTKSIMDIITITMVLKDTRGALQSVLALLSEVGANVVTINQAEPNNETAIVSITMATSNVEIGVDELVEKLKKQEAVIDIKYNL